MLHFLPPVILGSLSFLLWVLNTLFWTIPFFTITFMKSILPWPAWRQLWTHVLIWIAETWVSGNNGIIRLTQKIRWDITGIEGLNRASRYLITSNHQSWVDIVLLLYIFNRRIPFPRFFTKQSLIWLPIVGQACWALDFPFMKRYSREFLEKHPELRGQDLETTRKACERFKHMPVSILNFLEGTRFTSEKHARQESPYRHLLRPKAGGIAFALAAMGERFDAMLNVTIIYPDGPINFWGLFSGQISQIIILVEQMPIPQEFLDGDYLNDPHFRKQFQTWVRALWHDKDTLIEQSLQKVK